MSSISPSSANAHQPSRMLGRYALFGELASGGMAVVHLGRLLGPVGFARTVAIKHLHPQFAQSPEFVAMFLDEARLAARIRHPNVVATLDVVAEGTEIFLVMDYVQGETLARLLRTAVARGELLSPALAVNIMLGVLSGLHAAHESTSEQGSLLGLVHRDVSPQNVMVGVDGVARVLDFGIAKAAGRTQMTREGELKGKISYMAPEQIRGGSVDRRADVYACGVVLWEALTSRRLFPGENDAERMYQVLQSAISPPSVYVPEVTPALDAIVMRAVANKPEDRFPTALAMALELERAVPLLSAREVGAWVSELARDTLTRRELQLELIESGGTPASLSSTVSLSPGDPTHTAMLPPQAEEAEEEEAVTVTGPSILAPRSVAGASSSPSITPPRRNLSGVGLAVGLGAVVGLAGAGLYWLGGSAARGTMAPSVAASATTSAALPSAPAAVAPASTAAPAGGADPSLAASATSSALAAPTAAGSASSVSAGGPASRPTASPPPARPASRPGTNVLQHRTLYTRD